MSRNTKLFLPGDIIPGLGMVDTNHFGLPWPVTIDGDCFLGTVTTTIGYEICDALTGEVLTKKQVEERMGNFDYDYEKKFQDCQKWREANGDEEQKGMRVVHEMRYGQDEKASSSSSKIMSLFRKMCNRKRVRN